MSGLCFVIAGSFFLAWSLFRHDRRLLLDLKEWKSALIIATMMLLGGQGARALAEQSISSGLTSVLFAIVPIFVVIITYIWLKKPLTKNMILWIVIGLVGLILLVLPLMVDENGKFRACLFLIAGAFLWALGSIHMRQSKSSSPLIFSLGKQMLLGGLLLTGVGILGGELNSLELAKITFQSALGMLYMIFIGSLVGFPIFVWLLHATSEFVANSFAFVSPVVAIILGSVTLSESIMWQSIIATSMILGSVVMIMVSTWKRKEEIAE